MSYNTRRSGNFGPQVSSVGQRRPPIVTNNFVPGGQMNRQTPGPQQSKGPQQQQNKPLFPQQQQAKPQAPVQQKPQVQQQQQAQQPTQQPKPAQLQQQPPPQPLVQPQQPVQPAQIKPVPPVVPQQVNMQRSAEQLVAQQQPLVAQPQQQDVKVFPQPPPSYGEGGDLQETNGGEGEVSAKPKPFWMKRSDSVVSGRITKAEKMRKRNIRLRKMLQPKNALMVLNELVGSTAYTVTDVKMPGYDDMFKASVSVDGIDHVGGGKSKVGAKTAAAETAIRYIVLKKISSFGQPSLSSTLNEGSQSDTGDGNGDVKMEADSVVDDTNEEQVSWSHIASFAIHKLFSSWDEDGNSIADMFSRASTPGGSINLESIKKGSPLAGFQMLEQKPAKKLPENATHMNPIMLLNQMHPTARYEEVSKTGNAPHIQFTIKCTVTDQTFVGVGPNKKAARKQAAFAACSKVLGIQYPPDVYDPSAEAAVGPNVAMDVA